jgi:isopenicillin N synthase-like dioxygenase
MAWPSVTFQAKVEACERRLAAYLIEQFNAVCEALFPGRTVTYASLLSSHEKHQESTDDPNPLDLFYYYNVMDGNEENFNCEPHVDRGLMHIVYSTSPGLEVFEAQTSNWLKVGGDSNSADPRTAVVFCNAALQTLTSGVSEPGSEAAAGLAPVQVRACVHRVVMGPSPRLSISLELRLR